MQQLKIKLKKALRAPLHAVLLALGLVSIAIAIVAYLYPSVLVPLLLIVVINLVVIDTRMRIYTQEATNKGVYNALNELSYKFDEKQHETTTEISKYIKQSNLDNIKHLYMHIESLFNIDKKIKLKKPLPSMTGGTASPELALLILNTVEENQHKTIVDIGSGISSVVAGYAVESNKNGNVLAVDHEEEFFKKTKQLVDEHGLSEVVKVVHAPLQEYKLDNKAYQWYENSKFEDVDSIDLLLVDGPPGFVQKHARYPAMPILYSKLSPEATVIIDDYKRGEEKQIVESWLKDYPEFSLEAIDSNKGIAVLQRRNTS